MIQPPLLEQLAHIAHGLGLPFEVGLYTQTPAPATYLVATPLADSFDVYADNTPGVEVEEVRLCVFAQGSYLPRARKPPPRTNRCRAHDHRAPLAISAVLAARNRPGSRSPGATTSGMRPIPATTTT